jgi:arylsulfatase A-like enzyme
MDPVHFAPGAPSGVAATLRSALGAGAACGLVFGLADGIVASSAGSAHRSLPALAGCLAAAVLQYSLLGMAALVVVGIAAHPLLRRRPAGFRYLLALRFGLAAGLFAELYWWTRPFVFYGRSATSPERLLATAAILAITLAAGWLAAMGISRAGDKVKRAAAMLAVLAWIGGAVFLFLQRGALGSRGERNERNRDLPNVLLVVVDALRQDALGCYGNLRVKTPSIDRLAAEGVLFENAFTQAPFTWSSFGSILTGKYPRRHGLLKMKDDVRMPPNLTLPLVLKRATKSDGTRLQDRDWLAATFHTGTLTEASGLLGGFDLRYEATAGHDLVVLDSPWSVFQANLLVSILRNKLTQHLDFGGTAAEARKWIADRGDRRFFAMVHLYSTHTPYDPPEEFRRMYCDPKYSGPVKSFWADHRKLIESGKYKPTLSDVAQIKNLYFGGVSQADAQIGGLVDALARRGILDDTLIVVMADHGESLGEKIGEETLWEHDHMVQTNLRIPLVMRWPKHLPAGKRVAALVDEIDVLPTVCALLGIAPPREEGEHGRIDGTSLLPLVHGEKTALRDVSFAENGLHVSVQDRHWKLVVPHSALLGADGGTRALENGSEVPRLYDLHRDPEERFNQFKKEPVEAERLFAAIRYWNENLPIPPDSLLESPRDIENQKRLLRKLGYVDGDSDGGGPGK